MILIAVACLEGCRTDPPLKTVRFGDPYEVVTTLGPGHPDQPPHIEDGMLLLTVTYVGGCRDHEFTLHYRQHQDTTRLWVEHLAHYDPCDSDLLDDLELPVPDEARGTTAIQLLNPEGAPPFIIR